MYILALHHTVWQVRAEFHIYIHYTIIFLRTSAIKHLNSMIIQITPQKIWDVIFRLSYAILKCHATIIQ